MSIGADQPFPPEEIPLTEARDVLGDLADAASHGQVVYLTRRGQRIAMIAPADPKMATNTEALTILDQFVAAHRALFDRLADA